MEISQESTCVGVLLNNVAGPENYNFIKKWLGTGFFLWILWIIQEHVFCVDDLRKAGSGTPVLLFNNTSFYRTFPVTAFDSLRFPACNFIKKETPAKTIFCELCNMFWQNTSGWMLMLSANLEKFFRSPLLLVPLGNCLFHVQVAEFQPPYTIKSILRVIFKHFIQKQDVAIRKRSFT